MPFDRLRIPRPPNAFILYRNYTAEKIRILHKQRTVQSKIVSMVAGHAWRLESEEVKMEFHCMAEAAKQEHRLRYPEYHFEPQKAKDAAAGAKRTRARDRNATKAAKALRKGRKAAVVYHVDPHTPPFSPSASSPFLSSTSSPSESSSLLPSPLPTPPPLVPVAPIGLGGFPHASQGPHKQPWMNAALAALNQLSPDGRSELMRRIQLLHGVASTMGTSQPFSSYPVGHGQHSGIHGPAQHSMLPNHHYQAHHGFMVPQVSPPFPYGAVPAMGVDYPDMGSLGLSGMQQAGWTQPDNVNCGFNPFAGPIAYHEPAHSPHAGASAQASDGAEHWATPWSSNSGHDSDHAIVIPDSPVQASMPMPDPLDMSSILSVPSDGTYEPRPSMSSVTQPTFTNAAPAELSDAEVVELLKSVVAPSMPSSMPSPSLLGISPADVATQDPLQTLPPSNVWPQGLNDWMDVDHTRM